ncbi:hypothetical protein SUGI_0757300 [Cryptomeria japonica]|nr:hypothetical protein SUGI_0757300 [Cryptomeria japonica]
MSSPEGFITDWLAKYETQHNGGGEEEIRTEVARVLKLYEKHYTLRAEAAAEEKPKLGTFFPLENDFVWLGEWRPSIIFHVAYAEIGQQLESELAELLKGTNSSNLAGLTSSQLFQINELHCRTVEEEDKLSHRLTALQKIMAAASNGEGFQQALDETSEELQCIFVAADRLRVETLKRMLYILTPRQCIQILVPALQMQFCPQSKKQNSLMASPFLHQLCQAV